MSIRTYAVNCNDAWLNTEGDDISGSYVKYRDHQEVVSALEAKCSALAAENSALSKFIDDECYVYGPHDVEPVDAALEKPETPATDAFLAEVRAQGVEMFAEMYACEAIKDGDVEGWKSNVSNAASEYAAQLRQEANTAELVAAGIITKVGE
ncbi:hypothetical protein AAHB66_13995 [Leclercia sp. S52]|uniref:hypothetical protein n=1 Tax=Leclercia sp. S52 TaxID=3138178 RepID=UPI00321C1B8F